MNNTQTPIGYNNGRLVEVDYTGEKISYNGIPLPGRGLGRSILVPVSNKGSIDIVVSSHWLRSQEANAFAKVNGSGQHSSAHFSPWHLLRDLRTCQPSPDYELHMIQFLEIEKK